MLKNINIGLIGFGNMGKAIAQGWLKKQVLEPHQIHACAKHYDLCQSYCEPLGIQAHEEIASLIHACDWIVIALKPYLVKKVLEPYKDALQKKVIISVAANMTFDIYEEILAPTTAHLSMIPNTPIAVGKGICVCEEKHSLNEAQVEIFHELFNRIAHLEFVATSQLSIAGTLCGCGPAFVSMMIEALGDSAVKHGLARSSVYTLASKMIEGTAVLQLESKKHPAQMKDEVCSPKGTTIQGVAKLEEKGFRDAIISAIDVIENK